MYSTWHAAHRLPEPLAELQAFRLRVGELAVQEAEPGDANQMLNELAAYLCRLEQLAEDRRQLGEYEKYANQR